MALSDRVCIVDYGVGNIISVLKFFRSMGFDASISNKQKDIENCNIAILPGVGSFDTAMKNIQELKIYETIQKRSVLNKPIIGICLGMQILCVDSEESPGVRGLGIFKSRVHQLEGKENMHIGWNTISSGQVDNTKISINGHVYFNHGYHVKSSFQGTILTSTYGSNAIASVVKNKNTIGIQFHPEKSYKMGVDTITKLIKVLSV